MPASSDTLDPDQAKAAGIWYEAGEWCIRSLDPLEGIRAGETWLSGEEKDGSTVYTISDSVKRAFLKSGEISLRWEACPEGEKAPFVYLEGDFGVKSAAGFREKDSHQWETEGLHADCMAVMIDGEKKPRYYWGPASYKSYAV